LKHRILGSCIEATLFKNLLALKNPQEPSNWSQLAIAEWELDEAANPKFQSAEQTGSTSQYTAGQPPEQIRRDPPSPKSRIAILTAEESIYRRTLSGPLERHLGQGEGKILRNSNQIRDLQIRVRLLRVQGLQLRCRLQNIRKILQQRQMAKSSADNAFMKYARELYSSCLQQRLSSTAPVFHSSCLPQLLSSTASTFEDSTLNNLYKNMQTTRDEYGEEEFAYNKLEGVMDEQDYELAKLEGELDTFCVPMPTSAAGDIHLPPPESLLGTSLDAPKELHPSLAKFLSRLGDLDLAKEKYQNMTHERDELLLQQESREPLGIELHQDDKDFLANFPSQEAALLSELVKIKVDVNRWKKKCLKEGINISEGSSGTHHESRGNSETSMHDELL
jgi:hypothetical protein